MTKPLIGLPDAMVMGATSSPQNGLENPEQQTAARAVSATVRGLSHDAPIKRGVAERFSMTHIVVVEDDVLVGLFVQEVLREAGFSVALTETPIEAAALFDEHVAAAVIDIGLPEQTGDQLAWQLREQFPALAILLTTGFDQHSYVTMFETDDRIDDLGKPFDGPDLLRVDGTKCHRLRLVKVVNGAPEERNFELGFRYPR